MASNQRTGRAARSGSVQTPTFWIDESGSKNTASRCFVVAGIKTRHPDDLLRAIHSIRERHSYAHEFKFGRINKRNAPYMVELVDLLADSDAHLIASVVGPDHNPFKGKAAWEAQADLISRLIVGSLNKNEVAAAFMDGISTPPDRSLGRAVKRGVNGRLQGTPLVTAVSLNSKTNDLLQAADLVAGAIRHQRMSDGPLQGVGVEKAKVADRLATAFGTKDLSDQRETRVNIATVRGRGTAGRRLRPVRDESHAS
ncbi:hypothetical protein HMPREF0063_10032 [Aeromicrobium marinum DSM 15272]|uniref:DUF3800 domain-containing protein n=1 Tax=Aeromicrobium marinum DSM 15272 TaxID=585531 RepID=E2S7M5_9ACTN|nr:DUF3800 domain-containing protein [Aeromicrobium marinum]EFQ84691.1 hypothetical protein HMPREF0063_10032 [Aeromicrobium marinum DSM 15272]